MSKGYRSVVEAGKIRMRKERGSEEVESEGLQLVREWVDVGLEQVGELLTHWKLPGVSVVFFFCTHSP